MIIAIDIGNTSAKYAVMDDKGEIISFERLKGSWKSAFEKIIKEYKEIKEVYVSNVAGAQSELETAIKDSGLEAKWLTWDSPIGKQWLNNIPEGYGADRLAADIGAIAACPTGPLLVVDAGTCITYDVIDANHTILGGSITPGIALRLRAMHEHTAALPLFEPEGFSPIIGTEIEGALRGGCANGVRWEIEGYAREMIAQLPGIKLFYTGGVPLVFAPEIEKFAVHDPYLVLRGLWHCFRK